VRHRAFTLSETLILIALTALLVSILTPSLSRGRDQARGLECLSNLRQTGTLHLDPFGRDRWGNSAYDLPESPSGGNNGLQGGNGTAPRRVGERLGPFFGIVFTENLEQQATEQPRFWRLTCPLATDEAGLPANSYGIYFLVINQPHTLYSTSRDLIFGCSDYRVVDVAQSFAFRHRGLASFYFGDHHVSAYGSDLFTDEQWNQQSTRGQPVR
jgi:type II secretory pathway pseudopilin PulG